MKKVVILLCMVAVIATQAVGQEKFMASVGGNMLFPADGGYKDVYGDSLFYPEFKLAYKVVKDFYLWVGYGLLSTSGETVELGAFYASYKEEAMQEEVSDSAVGFRVDGSLIYRIGKSLFAGLSLGYLAASDDIEGVSIKLGGFKGGLLLGLKF
jgi:hypothetical protein